MGTAYNTSDWLRSCPEKTFITNKEENLKRLLRSGLVQQRIHASLPLSLRAALHFAFAITTAKRHMCAGCYVKLVVNICLA